MHRESGQVGCCDRVTLSQRIMEKSGRGGDRELADEAPNVRPVYTERLHLVFLYNLT